MTHLDFTAHTAPDARIGELRQSTVAAILRAAQLGLFTEAEANSLINRVRTHVTTSPLPSRDSLPSMGNRQTSEVLSISPNRTV
jgi:hypothetical protein